MLDMNKYIAENSIIINGKIVEINVSDGFCGKWFQVFAKIKGGKTVMTQTQNPVEYKVGDNVEIRKTKSIGYSNRYEYKILNI